MKYKKLRFKILFIMMFFGVMSLVTVGIYNYKEQKKLLYEISNEKLMMIMKVMRKNERERERSYLTHLHSIINNEVFLNDISSNNLENIQKYLQKKSDIFKAADASFEYFHLYHANGVHYDFELSDNVVHSKNNVVLNTALKNRDITRGFVSADEEIYYNSLVIPIFNKDVVVAYLELAFLADDNIKLATKVGRYKYALYINKYNKVTQKREIGEVVVSNSSIFENMNLDQEFIYRYANKNEILQYGSEYYLLSQYDIETIYQKNFAQNILANNVTKFVKDNYERLFIYAFFSILSLSILFFIIYQYVTRLINKLIQDEEKLLSQKDEIQLIMDNSENFIVVYENYKLKFVNRPFLSFFNTHSLRGFEKIYGSIESQFENMDDTFVCQYVPNTKWIDEIALLSVKERIVAITHNSDEVHYFTLKVSALKENKSLQIVSFSEITALFSGAKKDRYDARHDTLTKVFNRKYFNEILESEIALTKNRVHSFTLVMFDIDFFKRVNDTYGHQVGDYVLIALCEVILLHIRSSDTFARWGGEEFILLLPGTDVDIAAKISEQLRKYIEENRLKDVEKITCSLGVTQYIENESLDSLVSRVDKALYRAKEKGRNRVEVL